MKEERKEGRTNHAQPTLFPFFSVGKKSRRNESATRWNLI